MVSSSAYVFVYQPHLLMKLFQQLSYDQQEYMC